MTIHHLKRDDTSPGIRRQLTEGAGATGSAIDLSGCTVTFQMRERENTFLQPAYGDDEGDLLIDADATIIQSTDPDGNIVDKGVVQYAWQPADTTVADTYLGEFTVTYGDGTRETFPNTGHMLVAIHPDLG